MKGATVCCLRTLLLISLASFVVGQLRYSPAYGFADPILKDFAGRTFEFLGSPGSYYNLYSDQAHQINMGLIPGFVDGHNGSYMNEFGLAFHNLRSQVSLTNEGSDILVQSWTQGKAGKHDMLASDSAAAYMVGQFQGAALTVSTEPFRSWTGRTVEILTETLKLSIWSVPAGERDSLGVEQPAYLNFNLTLLGPTAGETPEGIIGESMHAIVEQAQTKASLGAVAENLPFNTTVAAFEGKGSIESYAVGSVFGTDFAFNKFGNAPERGMIARRSMQSSPSQILSFPIIGSGSNLAC